MQRQQRTSGNFFFRSPMRDYFQWKFRKKLNFSNETKSGQRNKHLFSLTFGELNYYSHLSSAQLDRWQAPTQRPIIGQRPVEQTAYLREIKDNGYKSVFTNSWLVRQRNRSWIKGLGKNQQKEWTRSLLAVPFVPGHWTVNPQTPEKRLHVYKSSATMARHAWHVDKAPAKTHKNRIACLYGLRCKLVKCCKNSYDKLRDEDIREKIKGAEAAHDNQQLSESWNIVSEVAGRRNSQAGNLKGKHQGNNHSSQLLGEPPTVEGTDVDISVVLDNLHIEEGSFSISEFEKAKESLKLGKSCGPDEITPEVIKLCDLDSNILYKVQSSAHGPAKNRAVVLTEHNSTAKIRRSKPNR